MLRLKKAYDGQTIKKTAMNKCYAQFRDGQQSTHDNKRSWRPKI
jgi:hypothetical protein